MTYTGITGFVPGPYPPGQQGVGCASNLDLSGILPPGQVGNCFKHDGELWIGSTALTAGGTNSRIGHITSLDGSITVTEGSGTIDLAGTAEPFQPNAVVELFDDFFPNNDGGGNISLGQLGWSAPSAGAAAISTTSSNHPGIVQFQSASFGVNNLNFILTSPAINLLGLILGGGQTVVNYNFSLVTLSSAGNRYVANIGLTDDLGIGTIANGVYFSYSDNVNSGNWVINCTSGSTTTSVNTTVPAVTGFTTFTVAVNPAGTSVSFYINNLLVGTAITTHIPTTALNPAISLIPSSGNTPQSLIDLFWLTINLSNPRPGPISPSTSGSPGRLILNYTHTIISYQVLGTDAIIGVNASGAVTITMPNTNVTVAQVWTIKDESGAAFTNNITIAGNGNNIDGSSTYVINNNYGSVDIYWNGTNFFII